MVKIFIDPGHGGSDPGATGNGLQEKTLTLQIALALRTILTNEYEGVTVLLSRTSDQYVSLSDRTNAANNWEQISFYPFTLMPGAEQVSKATFIRESEHRQRLINRRFTLKSYKLSTFPTAAKKQQTSTY